MLRTYRPRLLLLLLLLCLSAWQQLPLKPQEQPLRQVCRQPPSASCQLPLALPGLLRAASQMAA